MFEDLVNDIVDIYVRNGWKGVTGGYSMWWKGVKCYCAAGAIRVSYFGQLELAHNLGMLGENWEKFIICGFDGYEIDGAADKESDWADEDHVCYLVGWEVYNRLNSMGLMV